MEPTKKNTTGGTAYVISAEALRKAFIVHLILGVIVAIGLNLFELNVFVGVVAGAVVILSYFWQYKKGKEPQGLLQVFTDSVYYLGFILTLTSLVIAMMFFDVEAGTTSATVVITQFGAAMTTTLVGMGFRIYYQNFGMTVEAAQLSAKEALEQSVKNFNVQMRTTNQTLSKLSMAMDKNLQETEKRNKQSLDLYEQTQQKITQIGEKSLSEYNQAAEALLNQSLAQFGSFAKNIVTELSKSKDEILAVNKTAYADASHELSTAFKVSFEHLRKELVLALDSLDDAAEKTSKELLTTSTSIGSLNRAIDGFSLQIEGIGQYAGTVASLDTAQKDFVTHLTSLSNSVKDKIADIMAKDKDVSKHISELSGEYKSLLEEYRRVAIGDELKQLVTEESGIVAELSKRQKALEAINEEWEKASKTMGENAELFTENLVKTSKFITQELGDNAFTASPKAQRA